MIKGTAFFYRVILSSSLMLQAEEGGRSWQDHTLTKKGKLQQSRDLNKVNWGVPSTHRRHNRQTRHWCDFNQKEKKIMRKEQSLVKWQKFSSAFYNRRQFIKSSNFVVNLAKKSHVSTKGTLGSALETSSEKKKNYPILCKNIKESKEIPLFIYPQDKLCTSIFLRRDIGTTNMRKVQFLTVSIVFTKYFIHFTFWRY